MWWRSSLASLLEMLSTVWKCGKLLLSCPWARWCNCAESRNNPLFCWRLLDMGYCRISCKDWRSQTWGFKAFWNLIQVGSPVRCWDSAESHIDYRWPQCSLCLRDEDVFAYPNVTDQARRWTSIGVTGCTNSWTMWLFGCATRDRSGLHGYEHLTTVCWKYLLSSADHDNLLPSAIQRYHQLFMPALQLINGILMTLGSKHISATNQVCSDLESIECTCSTSALGVGIRFVTPWYHYHIAQDGNRLYTFVHSGRDASDRVSLLKYSSSCSETRTGQWIFWWSA